MKNGKEREREMEKVFDGNNWIEKFFFADLCREKILLWKCFSHSYIESLCVELFISSSEGGSEWKNKFI